MATSAPVASTQVAANSAFGGPTAAQAAAANAALANPTATATAPTTVPTTAPTGQTATSAPPATPTTVVSSQPASTTAQTMVGTLTQAQQDIQNQQSIKAANAANEKAGLVAAGSSNSSTFVTPNTSATPPTPEQQIADTPDTGNQWIYDAQGNKSQVPIGSALPTGYSTTNPTTGPTTPVTDTTTDPVGNVIKQLSDGTYAKYNVAGVYVGPASSSDFTQSKNGESLMNSINEVANGTYPLTANQQAQVDGIKAQFASLIATQQVANANLTGGTTVAENLYGMGNTLTGLGEIKGTVDSGIQKIADLNSQMASAVAQMEAGFQTDDMNLLKSAYDTYSSTVAARQSELDTIQAAAAKALSDANAAAEQKREFDQGEIDKANAITASQNTATDNDIRAAIDDASKNGASATTIASMQKALTTHDYAGAITAAGNTLQDPTSTGGMYNAYVAQQKAAGKSPMSAGDFLAAQKYKESYATASAAADAQGAYTESDANQSKLEHQLQQAALSSRSDLGIQNKKVSSAIDLKTLLNQYKDTNGNYNVPATAYTELAVGMATLLSPTGVPAQSVVQDLQQATLKGDLAGALTYATGVQQTGTTQNILTNLADSIDRQGQTAEVLRDKELDAETPSDLDEDRAQAVQDKLPSYDNMSNGDISYQSPEQINDTAVSALAQFKQNNADAYNALVAAFPNASPTWVAQQAGLLPSTQ